MATLICINPDGAEYKNKKFTYKQVFHTNRWWHRIALEEMSDSFANYKPGMENDLADTKPRRGRPLKDTDDDNGG